MYTAFGSFGAFRTISYPCFVVSRYLLYLHVPFLYLKYLVRWEGMYASYVPAVTCCCWHVRQHGRVYIYYCALHPREPLTLMGSLSRCYITIIVKHGFDDGKRWQQKRPRGGHTKTLNIPGACFKLEINYFLRMRESKLDLESVHIYFLIVHTSYLGMLWICIRRIPPLSWVVGSL